MPDQAVVLRAEADRILVRCTFEDKDLVKSVPGARWDPARRLWHTPKDMLSATRLIANFTDRVLDVDPEVQELVYTAPAEALQPVVYTPPADITITTTQSAIEIESLFKHLDLIKSVPGGRWDPEKRVWVYAKSPSTAADMVAKWSNHNLRIVSDAGFRAIFTATERLEQAAAVREADDLPNIPGIVTNAWNHQRQAYWLVASIWGKDVSHAR